MHWSPRSITGTSGADAQTRHVVRVEMLAAIAWFPRWIPFEGGLRQRVGWRLGSAVDRRSSCGARRVSCALPGSRAGGTRGTREPPSRTPSGRKRVHLLRASASRVRGAGRPSRGAGLLRHASLRPPAPDAEEVERVLPAVLPDVLAQRAARHARGREHERTRRSPMSSTPPPAAAEPLVASGLPAAAGDGVELIGDRLVTLVLSSSSMTRRALREHIWQHRGSTPSTSSASGAGGGARHSRRGSDPRNGRASLALCSLMLGGDGARFRPTAYAKAVRAYIEYRRFDYQVTH